MIGRILLTLAVLAVTGFVLLVLIGLWDRYEQETAAADFRRYERCLASQAGFSSDPKARAAAEAERAPAAVGREQLAPAQFFQQGQKLVGTGAVGSTNQGMSVALSADGNTAIVGGPGPNNADRDRSPFGGPAGGAWVFTRTGGVWTQQGHKLVGTTREYGGGLWSQGASVALSADGNTAIVGGPGDNRTTGAAWVFTRSGDVWTQQGDKLVGTGAYRAGEVPLPLGQGMSVALSADGNTAIVGGWRNGARRRGCSPAAAVSGRSKATSWSAPARWEAPAKACPSRCPPTATPPSWAGGPTTARPGRRGCSRAGGGVWTQQGNKLVGTGAVGSARQGMSVALSADGNTAIVGGPGDNPWDRSVPFGLGPAGAAWVFARSAVSGRNKATSWSARPGSARQGMSVALSADGNIAIVGGIADDGGVGAASVFTRSGVHWTQEKNLVGADAVGQSAPAVAVSGDGSIVMVGGFNDNGGVGAAWVFTRSGGDWTQDKYLVGAGAVGKLH